MSNQEDETVFTHPEEAFARPAVGFDPVVYRRDGDYDPAALLDALTAQPELAPFADERGNQQSAVRIDRTLDGDGYWISVPEDVAETVVDTAIAAYVAPTPPDPDPDPEPEGSTRKARPAKG